MLRTDKNQSIDEIHNIFSNVNSIVLANYSGMPVEQISSLRNQLRDCDAKIKIVKNTLFKIAASRANVKNLNKICKGPVAIIFSNEPVSLSKVLTNFAKDTEHLKVLGCVLDNETADKSVVEQLSKVPNMDTLRSMLIGLINAPATKVARAIKEPAAQLARLINTRAE